MERREHDGPSGRRPGTGRGRLALAAGLAALLLGAAACRREPAPEPVPPDEAARLLVNRNWLDRHPDESKKRKFHVLRLVPAFNMSGVYQNRTMFHGEFELFFFRHTGDQLSFDLPHTRTKLRTRYRIERLKPGEHPPFDLRLRLERSPRGPRIYFGLSSERAASLEPEAGTLLGRAALRRR